MSEEYKAVARRFYDDVLSQGNADVIDELVADDFVEHEAFPGLPNNREGVKGFVDMFRTAFPDMKATIDDLLVDGDKVVVRSTFSGTHKGSFMELAPTGKQMSVHAIDIVRFANGKVVEHWGVTDQMSMMQQLGAIPE